MTDASVKRLALILAVQAEIEGMKAANMDRDYPAESVAYDDAAFQAKAEELRNLAYGHDEQVGL